MTSNNGDLERVLRENLKLRRQVVAEFTKASEPISFGSVHQWWSARFGRAEDQPLFFALLFVLIAATLYVFL
jgi:hypothetical protein